MAQHLDEECGIKGHFKGDLHTCRHFDDVRYPRAWHLAPPLSPLPPPPSPLPSLPDHAACASPAGVASGA